jgi:hypothetical protein
MIDWTKPIETMDRRRVNWVADLIEVGTVIYVYPVSPDNRGDSFIVNHEGFRVDDRALFSARQEPFIRNVKVKKEGWQTIHRTRHGKYTGSILYESEELAHKAGSHFSDYVATVKIEWEE